LNKENGSTVMIALLR